MNNKRQELLLKKLDRTLGGLIKAHSNRDRDRVNALLQELQMPSRKEWRKLIKKLIFSNVEAGILRAHTEIDRLRELYEFSETWKPRSSYGYEVAFSKDALEFLNNYSYEIGVITEETVIERVRDALREGLEEGKSNKELYDLVKEKAETWMSPAHAQTIARTESGKMYNAGKLARYQDPMLERFVEALQYDAIVDHRTTEVCEHLDGRIIPITETATINKYSPPNHYQCRATWLPVTRFEQWENSWDHSQDPDSGFTSDYGLPKLLQGQEEPLVRPKE